MRDLIVRALEWALALLTRPHETHPPAPATPTPPSPTPGIDHWLQPWTTPSKEEAAAIFAAERTLALTRQAERGRAAGPATAEPNPPYAYPGAPFPASAFYRAGGLR